MIKSNTVILGNLSFWIRDSLPIHDLIVVGGGIVGWNAAITAKRVHPNSQVAIIEHDPLPAGASARNAGFACFGSMTELLADERQQGRVATLEVVERRWKGLLEMRRLLGDEAIDYQPIGGYELFREVDAASYHDCVSQLDAWNEDLQQIIPGFQIFSPKDQLTKTWGWPHIKHLIYNRGEGALHPGKMMQALQRLGLSLGISYYPGVPVENYVEESQVVAVQTKLDLTFNTRHLLFCTNGFTGKHFPSLALQAARNVVLLTQSLPQIKWQGTFHFHEGYVYFRRVGERVLIGGARHLDPIGETTTLPGYPPKIVAWLADWLKENILGPTPFEIEHIWSGTLGVGPNKVPIVKRINERVGVAVRLGGMGVAIGTLVGQEGAQLFLDNL